MYSCCIYQPCVCCVFPIQFKVSVDIRAKDAGVLVEQYAKVDDNVSIKGKEPHPLPTPTPPTCCVCREIKPPWPRSLAGLLMPLLIAHPLI